MRIIKQIAILVIATAIVALIFNVNGSSDIITHIKGLIYSLFTTKISDINSNPQLYENRTVSIQGRLGIGTNSLMCTPTGEGCALRDSQGFSINVYLPNDRTYFDMYNYNLKGYTAYNSGCKCYYFNATEAAALGP